MSDNSDRHEDWRRWEAEGRSARYGTSCPYPADTDAAWFWQLGQDHAQQSVKARAALIRQAVADTARQRRENLDAIGEKS